MGGCCITPSPELSDNGGVAARREGDIPWKLGSTAAAAKVLRQEHDRGQGMWWEANATYPGRSRDVVPPSSERFDGDSCSREGNVFFPTLSQAETSLSGGRRSGRRSLGGSTTVGAVRTGLRQGAATEEATAKNPSAGVQPWAMEIKVLR